MKLTPLATLQHKDAISTVLHAYAGACDERDWAAFADVFCDDVSVCYGGEITLQGRADVVDMIRSMLGGCGPTQHLIGNIEIDVKGETAASRCYVRAVHAAREKTSDTLYDVWAAYHDEFVLKDQRWLIARREMHVIKETGSRDVLEPG